MFEVPKGEPAPDEERSAELDEVERYLGRYRETGTGREVEVLFQDGRLALRIPETPTPVELFPPEADGAWRVRLQPQVSITFSEEDGLVVGYSARGPGGEATFERISGPDAGPGPDASPSPASSS
jgi:hypothetical protein